MNEGLPYEEELARQLNNVPLPDENSAWEDMKRRLEKDDDDPIIITPVSKGCLSYSLLLVGLLVALFFIITHEKRQLHRKEEDNVNSKKQNVRKEREILVTTEINDSQNRKNAKINGSDSIVQAVKKRDDLIQKQSVKIKKDQRSNERVTASQAARTKKAIGISEPEESAVSENSILKQGQYADSIANDGSNKNINSSRRDKDSISESEIKPARDSMVSKQKFNDQKNDNAVKKDSGSTKKIDFAAGVALHQLLPVDGQKLFPYNAFGRKGTFTDYVPSVYFRIYKDRKWFIEFEFRYGAPQYNKEVLYHQEKIVDTFNRTTLSTSSRLKKNFITNYR